ncbi:MAG: hypothetical protein WCT03_15085 [Candidatus Obscuribacterales bacterium]
MNESASTGTRHTNPPLSLEQRFTDCVNGLPDSECLDLPDFVQKQGSKKADYLLNKRRSILEIKTIASDPSQKLEALLQKLIYSRPDCPRFFGKEIPLEHILNKLPDGRKIQNEITYKMTRAIQDSIEKADDQIASTKQDLGLPNAYGFMVILNDRVDAFSPEVIRSATLKMLNKRTRFGKLVCTNLDFVLVISETHHYTLHSGMELLPMFRIIANPVTVTKEADEFISQLEVAFAKSEGQPLLEPKDSSYIPNTKTRKR